MMRRLLLAIARAVALLILVAGFSGALTLALPNVSPAIRYGSALLLGVALFETLRPRERRDSIAEPGTVVPAGTPEDLVEAQRVIDELRTEIQSNREESQGRTDSLTRDVQDVLQINSGLRQQIDSVESTLSQVRAKAAEEAQKVRAQIEREKQNTAALQKTADALQGERAKLQ